MNKVKDDKALWEKFWVAMAKSLKEAASNGARLSDCYTSMMDISSAIQDHDEFTLEEQDKIDIYLNGEDKLSMEGGKGSDAWDAVLEVVATCYGVRS